MATDNKAPKSANYVIYQSELGPPWLRRRDGTAWEKAFGHVKDYFAWLAAGAVRIHAIPYADRDALALLGTERRFVQYPDEYIEAYRDRVQGAWSFWPMGGTRPGMLWAFLVAGYRADLIEWGLDPPLGNNDRVFWSEFSLDLYPARSGLIARDWGQRIVAEDGTEHPAVWGPPIDMPVSKIAARAPGVKWDEIGLTWDKAGWTWDTGAPPGTGAVPQAYGGLWGWTIARSEHERIMGIIRQMKSGHSKLRWARYIEGNMVVWGPAYNWADKTWGESRYITIYPPAPQIQPAPSEVNHAP